MELKLWLYHKGMLETVLLWSWWPRLASVKSYCIRTSTPLCIDRKEKWSQCCVIGLYRYSSCENDKCAAPTYLVLRECVPKQRWQASLFPSPKVSKGTIRETVHLIPSRSPFATNFWLAIVSFAKLRRYKATGNKDVAGGVAIGLSNCLSFVPYCELNCRLNMKYRVLHLLIWNGCDRDEW